MKKGQQVIVHANPKADDSTIIGTATLIAFDNNQVYLDGHHGYENWKAELNGLERNIIVHPRHLVKE